MADLHMSAIVMLRCQLSGVSPLDMLVKCDTILIRRLLLQAP